MASELQTVAHRRCDLWLEGICDELNVWLDGDEPFRAEDFGDLCEWILSGRIIYIWAYDYEVIAKHVAWEFRRTQPVDGLGFIRNALRSALERGFGKHAPAEELMKALKAERERLTNLDGYNEGLRSSESTGSAIHITVAEEARNLKVEESKRKVEAIDTLLYLYDDTATAAAPEEQARGDRSIMDEGRQRSTMIRGPFQMVIKERSHYHDDSNVMDEIRAVRRALDSTDIRAQDFAASMGISRGHLSNRLRILKLPQGLQDCVGYGKLAWTTARELLAFVGRDCDHSEELWEIERQIWAYSGAMPISVLRECMVAARERHNTRWRRISARSEDWMSGEEEMLFDVEHFKRDHKRLIHRLPVDASLGARNGPYTCAVDEFDRLQEEGRGALQRRFDEGGQRN